MIAFYLYLNAALYALFAAWCTLRPADTARAIGFEQLSNSGRSEYLVIYGGLQLGLAMVFWMFARSPQLRYQGLLLSVLIYVPLVVYRTITVLSFQPVKPITLMTFALEASLLAGAVALLLLVAER